MEMKEKGMQKKMYIVIAAAVAVAALAALALILVAGKREDAYRSIRIIELGGSVTIEREGIGALAASSNMNLISGDAVKTEQDAYAVLQLDSDKYVMLAESGSMTVVAEGNEASGRTSIRLDSGSVLSEIQNPLSNGSSYDIVTPNATMSVRGTVFEVRRNESDSAGNIEVLVYDGKVAVGFEGKEPVLYEAGEYTQFTSGDSPQFIVERTEITEEHLNPQFMERLEQIDSQSRELNLGTAQLASAQTRSEADGPQQTPAVSEPTVPPSPTAAPQQAQAATPEPSPAATQAPASTPKPQAGSEAPNIEAPASPDAEADARDDDDDDDDDADQDRADNSGSTQQPDGNNNGNHGNNGNQGNNGNHGGQGNGSGNIDDKQNFWQKYTMEEYNRAASGTAAGTECTVIYYVPTVAAVAAATESADNKSYSTLVADPPQYTDEQVKAGDLLTKPADPVCPGGLSLTFMGWCLEDGTVWDFDNDAVKADTCLYPLWKDDATRYFPVICRSAEQWCYYCNIVKSGTYLKENSLSVSNNPAFQGWEKVNNGTGIWDMETDTVQNTQSLKASWSSN